MKILTKKRGGCLPNPTLDAGELVDATRLTSALSKALFSSFTDTHCLLQVRDQETDNQWVRVNVVHAVLRWFCSGPYSLIDGFFAGALGGTIIRVVGKALGHLILTGGGALGHSQQARWIQLGQRSKQEIISGSCKEMIKETRYSNWIISSCSHQTPSVISDSRQRPRMLLCLIHPVLTACTVGFSKLPEVLISPNICKNMVWLISAFCISLNELHEGENCTWELIYSLWPNDPLATWFMVLSVSASSCVLVSDPGRMKILK